ncbi:MAG: M24 family metallopeptidase, partial [Chlorobi bacterium]|nr:M24 family metallopeptidase [Chlorobiota bacterium]
SSDKQRLLDVTRESLFRGIEQARVGNRLHDISYAVQSHVEEHGFSVVRSLVGHGIGRNLHEEPQVPNFGRARTGMKLKAGMTLAIEPMVNMGKADVVVGDDHWTVQTADGLPSAHFEHTVYISSNGPVLLTNHFVEEYA